ncbi:MAG: 50S ribosomal protein L21 [Candidatus Levybacteria bacterium]|nr:50S ribosomal protein L21 [Candidatus Levybacteria bacterium]
MEYAVIKTGGKQYRVAAGDVLEVDKLPQAKDSVVTFEDVLLLVSDASVKIGKPKLSGAFVKAKILEQKKGEKIRVSKFKAKVRYRRTIGFRPLLSKILIEKIESKASAIK